MNKLNTKRSRRVLVVDDNLRIHDDFRKIFKSGNTGDTQLQDAKKAFLGVETTGIDVDEFRLSFAFQGDEALEIVRQAQLENDSFAVAFIDIRMPPGRDGIETIQAMWEIDPSIQAVICTAYSDYTWRDMVEVLGQTDQLLILKKPFDEIEVRQMACALYKKWLLLNHLDHLVAERTEQITATRDVAMFALANLAESRDPETGEHLDRIRRYCRILSTQLAADSPYSELIDDEFIANVYRSSPLHDIGKVGIPDHILLKPGKLASDEFELMKQHSVIGAESLRKSLQGQEVGEFLDMSIDIARHHHEWYDGSGYPDGLVSEQIPLSARIVALADVFDALTTPRIYKEAWPPDRARAVIEEECGDHFDPVVVEAFLARWDDFLAVWEEISQPEAVLV